MVDLPTSYSISSSSMLMLSLAELGESKRRHVYDPSEIGMFVISRSRSPI